MVGNLRLFDVACSHSVILGSPEFAVTGSAWPAYFFNAFKCRVAQMQRCVIATRDMYRTFRITLIDQFLFSFNLKYHA